MAGYGPVLTSAHILTGKKHESFGLLLKMSRNSKGKAFLLFLEDNK